MQLPLTGGCLCGEMRYEVIEAPRLTYACHCRDCQSATGSAFSLGIVIPDSSFKLIKGAPKLYAHTGDSGRTGVRWLCPQCGSWFSGAPFSGWGLEGLVMLVRAGTLDDTSWLRPTIHFWTRSKQPWVVLPEGDTVYDTQPG